MAREIPLKRWRHEEAAREHVTESAIVKRFYAYGKYPHLKLRRINRRVILVSS